MKKICILSMQMIDNFGSLLQSYSLKKTCEELGHNVQFIDIEKNELDNKLLDNSEDYTKETLQNEGKLSKIDKYFLNRIIIKHKNKKQSKIFELFRKNNLNISLSNNSNDNEYDTCIIGSDEVFNCNAKSNWGFTTQLFGNVKNAKNVITYAASCGSTRYENVNQKVLEKISTAFKNINAFSVRDENTYDFVKKITSKKIDYNLDPVLIGDFDREMKENRKIKLPKRFCILYSYYNRFNNPKEIKCISNFCKENNMDIITLGAPQFWVKKHLVMNPFQMLYAFSKAEYVITDTFHGTIFASKYSRRFSVILRDSNKNKLNDLIKRLKKERHLCSDIEDIKKIYKINNNIEETRIICKSEREKTINYLNRNI